MKAPATSNVNAPRLLATDPMGGSPALGDLRSQQALSMAGALGPTVPAQRAGGLLEQGRQQQMALTRSSWGPTRRWAACRPSWRRRPRATTCRSSPT
jgi:hypothetical protein